MDHFLHRCTHDAFYKNKNTIKGVDHPCSACAKCIKNRLYDPDPCEVCSQWLKHIKENSVDAENSGSLWVKWNRSLVSAWKHNKVPSYLVPGVDMLKWADTEKFALWEPLLPVPKIRIRRQKSGGSDTSLPQTPSPVTTSLLPAGQGVAPQVTPGPHPTAPLPESCVRPIEATRDPSVGGSEWSGFPDDLEEPFPDLFSDLELAPPIAALNPSQKRACSPEPPGRDEPVEPGAPVSLPAADQSGFSAGQLATLKALIQSCLAPRPFFRHFQRRPLRCTLRFSRRHLRLAPRERGPPVFFVLRHRQPLPLDRQAFGRLRSRLRNLVLLGLPTLLAGDTEELTEEPKFVVLSDSEEGDAVTPPMGRSRLDPLHLAGRETSRGLAFLRRGRYGDLPSPPCVLQDVVSDGSGCRQPLRGAGALFSSCLSRPRVIHHSRGHASVFVQKPDCRPVSPSCHCPAFPQQPSSLSRCRPPHIPHPHCEPSPPRLCLHTPLLFCLPSCRSPELLGSAGRFRSKHSGLSHPRT